MTIRVVVVDDSADIREMVAAICQTDPEFQVVGDASSGESAIPLIRATAPDVALVDIMMPGIDGVETARRALAVMPGLKVVALSGHHDYEIVHEMLSLGVVGYLVKDTLVEDLPAALRAAVSGSTVLSPAVAAQLLDPPVRPVTEDFGLSDREIEVLGRMGSGFTDARIAEELEISTSTVRFHQSNILQKMNVATRSEALVAAARCGLI